MNAHSNLKFGRRPARYTRASMIRSQIVAMNFALLGPPPKSSDDYVSAVDAVTGGDWGMMGNDSVGDCTCADCGHQLMLRTANASTIMIPTEADIIALYENFGYVPGKLSTDQGADELSVCNYMQKYGLLGHTTDAYANLNPTNLNSLKWTVQLYGCSRLGIACTDSMIDQFDKGQPWEPVAGATVEGGHDVPLVRYITDGGSTMYFVVTWGKLQPATEAWLTWVLEDGTPVVEEARMLSPPMTSSRPRACLHRGLDHDQMIAEMQAVSE